MADSDKPAREEEFYYLLTEGSEHLQAGRVDDARMHFERALEMNPSHEQALNLLGLSLFRLNQLDRARQIFSELVFNNPIEPSLRLNLAMVHLKTGRLDDAKIELERVLELSPDHPRATSYMGLVLERKGDLDRAAIFYEKAGNKKRADEIRAYRPTQTGTFPMPNLQAMVQQAQQQEAQKPAPPVSTAPAASPPPKHAAIPPSPPPSTMSSIASSVSPSSSTIGPAPTPQSASQAPRPISSIVAKSAVDGSNLSGSVSTPPSQLSGASAQGTEAAALTAATAAQLKRASEPPAAAAVESARGSSLGFTLEVDEREKKPVSQTPTLTPSTVGTPGANGAPITLLPSPTPAANAGAAPSGAALLDTNLAELIAGAITADVPVLRDDGILAFPVPDVGYVRTDMLVALAGQFEVEPVNRRYRGKRTDSLFGGPDAAIVALLGKGLSLLLPKDLSVRLLTLKSEELYLVEGALLAFTQGLVWENGRLPSESDRDLDIVHLRGSGRLVVGTESPLLALTVRPEQPVTVHASRLIGWNGQLVPYRAPLPGLPESARRIPVVRFEGTGVVLAV